MSEMSELEPCPHCGGKIEILQLPLKGLPAFQCFGCCRNWTPQRFITHADAVDFWNSHNHPINHAEAFYEEEGTL
jgi:hypothetical protein